MATAMASPSSSSRWVQHGLARLRATADASGKTRLTQVSHQSPLRLVPIPSTSIQQAGAAMCALSSYGGGMLPGDVHDITVDIQEKATLGLITQGPSRIYKRNKDAFEQDLTCRSALQAHVASDALFVFAMDPCVPFQHSAFQQSLDVTLEGRASCILVDWACAGRLARGEFWNFDVMSSRTSLLKSGDELPFLVESMYLDNNDSKYHGDDPFGFQNSWGAYASVILHGPQARPVAQRLQQLSLQLTSEYTRVRDANMFNEDMNESLSLPLASGRVLIGVNEIETTNQPDEGSKTYLARVATTCNEDLYRILHTALEPLAPKFGIEFYRDRIHSGQTAAKNTTSATAVESRRIRNTTSRQAVTPRHASDAPTRFHKNGTSSNTSACLSSWTAFMLADSGLPTGSFAHSAGIEAAAQLGLLRNDEDKEKALPHFIHAAVKSSLQLHVPFVIASFQGDSITFESFNKLDRQMHAYMVSNSVACRASLEQGQGLLRVAIKWLQERQDNNGENDENLVLLQDIQDSIVDGNTHGHVAPIFGIVCSSLGLSHDANEACRLLGYCTARDIVSAAVRLNLVGPMAGVALLDSCMTAVEEGIASARAQHQAVDDAREDENGEASVINSRMIQASTCAPIVETVHPCHEILSVRLFRT